MRLAGPDARAQRVAKIARYPDSATMLVKRERAIAALARPGSPISRYGLSKPAPSACGSKPARAARLAESIATPLTARNARSTLDRRVPHGKAEDQVAEQDVGHGRRHDTDQDRGGRVPSWSGSRSRSSPTATMTRPVRLAGRRDQARRPVAI